MDADRLELEIRRVSVSQLIESCIETARHRATEKEIAISVQPFNGVPDIAGDRRRLAEVLQNLLDNALQYTLSRREIVVSAEPRDGEVVFTVADTGIGIPKADQSRIFQRFYPVHAHPARMFGLTRGRVVRRRPSVRGAHRWRAPEPDSPKQGCTTRW